MAVEEGRAAIYEVDRLTGAKRIFASGTRNPTGVAFEPQTHQLFAVVNERDENGPDLVPDYLTSIRQGARESDPEASDASPRRVLILDFVGSAETVLDRLESALVFGSQ